MEVMAPQYIRPMLTTAWTGCAASRHRMTTIAVSVLRLHHLGHISCHVELRVAHARKLRWLEQNTVG